MLSLSNRWVILLILSLTSIGVFAQQSFITGTVTSAEDGLPIPGVSVVVKGTTTGTITDMDGKYNIKVWQGKELLFSFIGMKNTTVIAEGGVINVKMEPESIGLEEVVAIGYGTQKKKELTGAVVQVKSDEITKIATSDLGDALQGKVAGVSVQSSSGAPGEGSNIQIRGVATSFEGSNNNPLYIVDGIPYDGDPGLSPNEIETIDVLKDAASAAAYGTRGAAGVILITTKQGKAGDVKVSYNGYYGIQNITSEMPLVGFDDYMYIESLNQITQSPEKNAENDFWYTLEQSPHQMSNDNSIMDVVQQDNAAIQNHSIQLSGGQKNLTASAVLNYFSQDGTLINSGYERMNGRANLNFQKNKLRVRAGFGFSVDEKKNAPYGILYEAYKFKPHSDMVDPNNLSFTNSGTDENEINNASRLAILFSQEDVTKGKAFNANTNINYQIVKGLNLTYTFGANYKNTFRKQVVPLFQIYDANGDLRNQTTRSSIKNTSGISSKITSEVGANYTKKFGKHKIKLLGVYTYERMEYGQHLGVKYDILNNGVTVLNGGSTEPNAESGMSIWTQDRTTTLIGLLGRVNYDYKGKYLVTASVRRDGSSKFGSDERWGVFPAFSAGWNISDEPFWLGVKDVVNVMKLRASWGTVGNQNFGDYLYSPAVTTGKDYVFGPETNEYLVLGATQTAYANPYVKWETSVSSNLGLDVYMLNNKVNFTAEVYNTEKQNMLFPFQVPASAGVGTGSGSTVPLNIGDMSNRGLELSAGYRHSGKFTWGINGTFSKNMNKVSMPGDINISYYTDGKPVANGQNNYVVTALADGYEAGAFFMMPTDGIINTETKLAEAQKIRADAKMGDLFYVDTNGDGELSDADRVYAGSGMPDWEAGINFDIAYKGFDFNMQWYASVGNEIINGSKLTAYFSKTHEDMLYQWTENNPYSQIPINRGRDHINYASFADIWVEDGSFLRLRNVILGYTIPKKLTSKAKISKCRVYLAAQNPITITKYDGYDPEIGSNGLSKRGLDVGNYPVAAQYRVGVQLDF